VEAEPSQFLEALGVEVKPGKATVSKVNPAADQLAELVDLVEVTPAAELLAE
jgi:hypothetical protein